MVEITEPRTRGGLAVSVERRLRGSRMELVIRPEVPADFDAVRGVNAAAFGQDAEAQLVDALRAGGYARLSLVAELDQHVVGHILFSDLAIVSPTGTVAA